MTIDLGAIQDKICNAYSAPPDENKTGVWKRFWVDSPSPYYLFRCSNCEAVVKSKKSVCPVCNAIMEEEE